MSASPIPVDRPPARPFCPIRWLFKFDVPLGFPPLVSQCLHVYSSCLHFLAKYDVQLSLFHAVALFFGQRLYPPALSQKAP